MIWLVSTSPTAPEGIDGVVLFVVKDTLKQTCLSPGGGASCFRNSNDSRPAIRIAYRTLLRSSSI
jgi:hypothetical protein